MPTDSDHYKKEWRERLALLTRANEACLRSCMSCEFFTERTEGCELAQGARPPARIIAYGCERWVEDIPF